MTFLRTYEEYYGHEAGAPEEAIDDTVFRRLLSAWHGDFTFYNHHKSTRFLGGRTAWRL